MIGPEKRKELTDIHEENDMKDRYPKTEPKAIAPVV